MYGGVVRGGINLVLLMNSFTETNHMEKRIEENIPVLGRVNLNFLDLASRIYKIYEKQDEVTRQKLTPHLGLISKAFYGINHSRYDYLILQCVISELAENTFRGTTSAQGSITINGKKYSGNDIIKSWILLSNFGHCKNTIGDEKALLIKVIQRKKLKSALMNSIKDLQLREWASNIIEEFDYVNFHHVLSIRRIYKCLPRRVEFQNEIINVYKLMLLDPNLTSDIARQFHLNKRSQTFQRSYEIESFNQMPENFNEAVDKAMLTGLSDPEKCFLDHFLRVELHTNYTEKVSLKEALRSTLTVKRELPNVEASLDYNPFTSKRVMDFYLATDRFQCYEMPKFLTNITAILEKQISATIKNHVQDRSAVIKGVKDGIKKIELDQELADEIYTSMTDSVFRESWGHVMNENLPVFKDILWAVLRYHIKNEFYFDIDHHTSTTHNFFGLRLKHIDYLNEDLEEAIKQSGDKDRVHELKQLRKSARRKYDGTTIACFSRVTIYDYSKAPSERKVTDIDSIILKFNEKGMSLELNETKNTKRPYADAKKDINDKLIRVLNGNSKGYQVKEVKGFGAKIVIKH